jgi:IclR family KDG regulon transcriptional repressor
MSRVGGRQRSPDGNGPDENSDLFVRALARGLTILALFDIEHPEWSLGEICERTAMSKTTAYRMLRTLEAKDFVGYDAKSERYRQGRAAIPGAYLALSHVGSVRSAHQFLEALAESTEETVELTVWGAEGAVVVDEVATPHPFRLNRPTGRIQSSLAQSSFRMHVAYRPEIEQRKIVGSTPAQSTPNSMADPEEMLRRLVVEKEQGLAFDLEELDKGVCAVSAPVLERDGNLMAVLSLAVPAERFGPRERKKKVEAVRNTAARMTEYLSGRGASC